MFEQIRQGGEIPFDKFICTSEALSSIKDLARVLGPKGLFPNAKSGTLIPPSDLSLTISKFKAGLIELRNDERGQVGINVGNIGMGLDNCKMNAVAAI